MIQADLDAKTYNKNSVLQKIYSRMLLNKINFTGNEKVLDIGCGYSVITSNLLKFFPDGEIFGIDTSI